MSKWKEEVQLSDGNVLLVTREVHYIPSGGEMFRSSPWIAGSERLTFVDPATKQQLTWQLPEKDHTYVQNWSRKQVTERTEPLRVAWYLDRYDGQFVLVAMQTVCGATALKGEPQYRAYFMSPSGTREVPMSEIHPSAPANMAFDARNYGKSSKWTRLTLAEKERLNAEHALFRADRFIDPNDNRSCP